MDKTWLIYGANGYTGRLCAREAARRGMRPILAGRNAAPINVLAGELGLEARVFPLDKPDAIVACLRDAALVLHCAGPFSATARPMLEACAQARTHYLDITGEIDVFEFVHHNARLWKEAGIAALPGVGFDVVPTDCLAALLTRSLPGATHLRLAFKSKYGKMSPGTAKTVLEGVSRGCCVRQDGVLRHLPLGSRTATVPFHDGPALAVAIPWGDVATAYYSTGIPNIEVYTGTSARELRLFRLVRALAPLLATRPIQALLKRHIARTVDGPTEAERAADEVQLYGEVWNAEGEKAAMTMRTPEGYTLTVAAALAAVERLLDHALEPGAYTASRAFSADFVLGLDRVECRPAP